MTYQTQDLKIQYSYDRVGRPRKPAKSELAIFYSVLRVTIPPIAAALRVERRGEISENILCWARALNTRRNSVLAPAEPCENAFGGSQW